MPANPNPTLWRTHRQTAKGYLYIHTPTVVFKALVNQADITYPLWDVPFDTVTIGAYTDIEPEMTVVIRNPSTNAIKGTMRVRDFAQPSFVKATAISEGTIDIDNNDIIEVTDQRRLWIKPPKITDAGVQFKEYTLDYTDNKQLPKSNIGCWYAGIIDPDTELITVPLSASESYPVASGGGTLDILWDIKDGSTSDPLTGATLTATFPAGARWISCRVTDDFGFQHTMYKLIVGVAREDALKVEVTALSGNVDGGWEAGFRLLESDVSAYPEGAAVIFWTEDKYGDTVDSLGGVSGYEHVKFCGWTVRETTLVTPDNSDWDIAAANTIGVIRNLPAFSQTLINYAGITSWFQQPQLDWWKYVVYLLQWHSNVLALCDLVRPSFHDDYPATGLDADAGTLQSQQEYAVKAVAARFTCDHQNRLFAARDPHMMSSTELNSVVISVTVTNADWTGEISIEAQHQPSVSQVTGYAVVADDTEIRAVKSIAPGNVVGQGGSPEVLDHQLVTGQAELNTRTGRLYAYRNRKVQSLSMSIINQGIVVDPAWGEVVVFSLAASSNRRGLTFSNQKFVPAKVSVVYDFTNASQEQGWDLEPIASFGAGTGITIQMPNDPPPDDGSDYVPSDGTWTDQTFQPPQYYVPFQPYVPSVVTNTNQTDYGIAFGEGGLYITDDFGVTWTESDNVIGYTCLSAIHSGNPDPADDPVKLSALWTNGTDCIVRYNADVFGAGTWTTKQTFTGYKGGVLRHVAGVVGGDAYAAFLYKDSSTWTETFDFTTGEHGFSILAGAAGVYTAGVGFVAQLDGGLWEIGITQDIDPTDITEWRFTFYTPIVVTGGSSLASACYTTDEDSNVVNESFIGSTIIGNNDLINNTGQNDVVNLAGEIRVSGSGSGTKIVSASASGTGTNPFTGETDARVYVEYTDDAWTTVSEVIGGEYANGDNAAGDPDDHNLGVLIFPANKGIWYTTSYDQAEAVELTGLQGVDGSAFLGLARNPYYKPDNPTSLNNDKNNIRFFYSTESAVGGSTLWLVTFSANTGVIKSEVDITPIIGGITYAGRGADCLESAGANPQRILFVGTPEDNVPADDSGVVLLYTTDMGISWVVRNTQIGVENLTFVRWNVGSLGQAWLSARTGNDVFYTENAGGLLVNKNGDLTAITDLRGAYGLSTT